MNLAQYLNELFEIGGERLGRSIAMWQTGIAYELSFWRRWFETKGREWPEDYRRRLVPQPLAPSLVSLLPRNADHMPRIMDVGAGPMTLMGMLAEGRQVNVVAVDPLAKLYSRIIDDYGVSPPLPTQFGFAEDLSARFDLASFDVVACTNALDHAIEPVWGILEMLMVTRPCGHVLLSHRRNEAEFERYSGFHQWNFDAEGPHFIIWNRDRRINVTKLLAGCADTTCNIEADYLGVNIAKRSELRMDMLTYQRRVRAALLEALLGLVWKEGTTKR
jgi:hypothetical protein